MAELIRTVTDLIASEVCGKKIERSEYALTEEELAKLYKISKTHDLAHLVGDALINNDLIRNKELEAKFRKQLLTAVYRYEKINYELSCLCKALCDAEISFLPLKGSVIRRYYPEPWMRTSCDIDVLVHEEDLRKAVSCLTETLGYRYESQSSHDISLFSQSGNHIELHYDISGDNAVDSAEKVLKTVWDTTVECDGNVYQYEMSDEMFYFYHIAHMAKHFADTGGCGMRPFLDIWILNHRVGFDGAKRSKLLSDGGLGVFAKQAELLSEIWFGNAQHTQVTKQMEEYILRGGLYGADANRVVVQQQKRGGKVRYALSKIFLPYEVIKYHYPILQKHKALTPIMEVRRWAKLIFCGHLKRTVKELKYNSTISEDVAAETRSLFKNVGL